MDERSIMHRYKATRWALLAGLIVIMIFGNDQLFPAFAGVSRARNNSPALRSSVSRGTSHRGWSWCYSPSSLLGYVVAHNE